jgi:Tol biopolymer transport system component
MVALFLVVPAAGSSVPSPAGRIVFEVEGGLDQINADGTGQLHFKRSDALNADFSPDGRRVVYTRNIDEGLSSQLRVADADGKHDHAITPDIIDQTDYDARWSPDGRWVAFTRYTEAASRIMLVRPGGGRARTVLTAPNTARIRQFVKPAWKDTRHLSYIALQTEQVGKHMELRYYLYEMTLDGRNRRRLLRDVESADWSRDGKKLVVASERDLRLDSRCGGSAHQETGCPPTTQIYVYDVDGMRPRRLVTSALPDAAPSWSTDGSYVAFTRPVLPYSANKWDVYAVRADGTCLHRLASAGTEPAQPRWLPGKISLGLTCA